MKINTLFVTALLSTTLSLASETNPTTISEMTVKQEGIKYIKMLGGALKGELQTHMKADKTGLSAMGFCTAQAESITKEVNAKLPKYASVRRTAIKSRNQNNAADVVDQKVMADYEASIKANINKNKADNIFTVSLTLVMVLATVLHVYANTQARLITVVR